MRDKDAHDETLTTVSKLVRPLYRYICRVTRSKQFVICVLTMILSPLSMAPLELQRRIIDDALLKGELNLMLLLGIAYFGVICLQGGLKFVLNMINGSVVETVARDLRLKIMAKTLRNDKRKTDSKTNTGTVVSMLSAETEDVAAFAGDALAVPLLNGGTILYVVGYLLWLEPVIAVLGILIYLPQAVIVPATQRTINRLGQLRIRLIRNIGHLAERTTPKASPRKAVPGAILIGRVYKLRMWIYLRKFLLTALGNFLDALGPLIVLMVGGYLVINGQTQVGTLVVFISGLAKIIDPWDQLINFYRTVSNSGVSYYMIDQALEVSSKKLVVPRELDSPRTPESR
jgi:ABC-type multidrug transport system fused ATPase/permease subunit